MSYAGIGVVRRLVAKLGLAGEIDGRLELLKRHLPYHESDHVLNIAYNLLCGGTRLEDLSALRNDAAYMVALGAAEVVRLANARCDQENVVAQLKSGVGATRVRPTTW